MRSSAASDVYKRQINFYNIDKKLIRKISVIIFKNLYKEESSLVKKKVLIFI
jgi:hypothetical protein